MHTEHSTLIHLRPVRNKHALATYMYTFKTDKTFLTSPSCNFKGGAPCCLLNPTLNGHRGSVAGVATGFLTRESWAAAGPALRAACTDQAAGVCCQASRRRGFTSSAGISAAGTEPVYQLLLCCYYCCCCPLFFFFLKIFEMSKY